MTTGTRRVRFDPHVHTDASYDANGSVEDVLTRCCDRGLDAVAITDHDTLASARRALEIQHEYDVTVVPGVEISTADGHLLALGVTIDPPIGESFASTVQWVRDRGGAAVAAHPFQRSRHGVSKRALEDCDAVEVFNAWAITGLQNRRAAAFARHYGYPEVGASDAHHPSTVGTAYTELIVDGELTVDIVLEAIACGRCRPVGESTSSADYLRKSVGSLGRWMRPNSGRLRTLTNWFHPGDPPRRSD